MDGPSATEALLAALTAVPAYEDPLTPLYQALGQQRPLTLRAVRQQSQLLQERAAQAHDQTFAVNQVIASCQHIPPTPLPALPLGF
ncbi:MAG: hypothetical protein KF770_20535 [Anaerolineae bacterium]|nr:hypothetical protein [Anaerolineae bacterium]